ncbi:hypothetical protein [Rubrivirga sp. IMCC45206]|uniref:hypothetical protein n=1 Tax=Rubrivirga sp. IMCC45206 TaxID=3391614 RepID=UPI00398FE786
MHRTLGLLLLASLASAVAAQPEIVPAEHRVYDWLVIQRVAGALPEYRHETRPVDRRVVRTHLDSLAARADRLGPGGRFWLGEFRREFFEPLDRVHSFVGDGGARLLDPDAERTFIYARDADWRASVWGEGVVEGRDADGTPGGLARSARLTFEASYRDWLGLYTSTLSGTQITGDAAVLADDPLLAPLYYVARDPSNITGPFDQTTASARVVAGAFSAEIANERLVYGASAEAPVVLSANADYLPFVRLGLRTRSITLEAVHAAMSSAPDVVSTGDSLFFDAPDRFLAIHRFEIQPTGWWTWAYTGMAVYGRRGPELAYLNPLFPVKAAEHALYDRDNTLFSLETTVRPLPGVEASFTWLVDDLATATLGDGEYGNKWAIQTGWRAAVPGSGLSAFGEYVRIEPYTYTHRFVDDGDFFNSYVHNGFGLGHPLGPNADQWLVGAEAWLPFRARARISGRYVRKGRNPIAEDGSVTQAGGDVRLGTPPDDGRAPFLAGDVFRGPGLRAQVEIEPARGVALRFYGDAQFWDDRPDDVFFRLGLAVRP